MNTEEDTRIDENEKSTLNNELDSTEADDLDSLFAEDETQEDAPVTREEYNRLLKGVQKLASQQGREKSQPVTKQETKETSSVSHQSDDVSELFFAQVPQAELVLKDLEAISKTTGKSILKVWKEESWLQDKAKALNDAKIADEENKSKISKPTSGTSASRVELSKVKSEDVSNLKPSEKLEWLKAQAQKEKEVID
jgi:enamine deaminase RidA (YjgF/YER057c/UK114 family)